MVITHNDFVSNFPVVKFNFAYLFSSFFLLFFSSSSSSTSIVNFYTGPYCITMTVARLLRSRSALLAARQPAYRFFCSSRLSAGPAPLDHSKLTISKTTTPKTLPPPEELKFGQTFTGKYPRHSHAVLRPVLPLCFGICP